MAENVTFTAEQLQALKALGVDVNSIAQKEQYKPTYNFYRFEKRSYNKEIIVQPVFSALYCDDIITAGSGIYAIYDEKTGLYLTKDPRQKLYYVIKKDALRYLESQNLDQGAVTLKTPDISGAQGTMGALDECLKHLPAGNINDMNPRLFFDTEPTDRHDRCSYKAPFDLADTPTPYYDKLTQVIFDDDTLKMVEWFYGIGMCMLPDKRGNLKGATGQIQKHLNIEGYGGTGKSTFYDIVKAVYGELISDMSFATVFTTNTNESTRCFAAPALYYIDGDASVSSLRNAEDYKKIVGHDTINIKQKYLGSYDKVITGLLGSFTNEPFDINTSKDGIGRRLLNARTTGNTLKEKEYFECMKHILNEELPAIAKRWKDRFLEMGPHAYDDWKPIEAMARSSIYYNFVSEHLVNTLYANGEIDLDRLPLTRAWEEFKTYADDVGYDISRHKVTKFTFRDSMGEYWHRYIDRDATARIDGKPHKNVFIDFRWSALGPKEGFKPHSDPVETTKPKFVLDQTESILDELYADQPAMYPTESGALVTTWEKCGTKLRNLDTTKVHHVLVPDPRHIVIDFDLKENGQKSRERNLKAIERWPLTYAEHSKSKAGVHLHYIYDGDPNKLASVIEDDIECKVYKGKASLRRVTGAGCNNEPMAHLPADFDLLRLKDVVTTNQGGGFDMAGATFEDRDKYLRSFIAKCIRKEHHGATAPEVDFIKEMLDRAYASGSSYDVRYLREDVLQFALSSTNQSDRCLRQVNKMHFCSDDVQDGDFEPEIEEIPTNEPIIFYDIECYPNLFLICWKEYGKDHVTRMVNPEPEAVRAFMTKKLVGFNNRKYDNHMIYAASIGYSNDDLYNLSQKLVSKGTTDATFMNAWNIGYADVMDIATKRQSLKKWEVDLGIFHKEMSIPWNEPVPDDRIEEVCEYCANDVIATEAVWDAIESDRKARAILCDLAGKPLITGKQTVIKNIIFPGLKNEDIKKQFVYTDLSQEFPGYTFDIEPVLLKSGEQAQKDGAPKFTPVSRYKGHEVGEGGWVWAEPGYYENVVCFDVASMHPHSLMALNLFGDYTKNFEAIVKTRLAIKHKDFDAARNMFDGRLAKYLDDESQAKDLAQALKLAINSVYGYTDQKGGPFYDPRNKDNIVAKRGALFMVEVFDAVTEAGYKVIHVKTDSIKIVNPDKACEDLVMSIGEKYGYKFEVEDRFAKICLLNNAAYIALDEDGKWHAKAAQMQEPYTFKTLFTGEEIVFDDLCVTKETKRDNPMYLDHGDGKRTYIGHVGRFCPVLEGPNLVKEVVLTDTIKYDSVTGTKGYHWQESYLLNGDMSQIDLSYFSNLADEARKNIEKWVSYEKFVMPF